MNNALMFSKASDEWRTPLETFNELNAEFGFDHDAAATSDNSWVDGDYFGPDHSYPSQRDALTIRWRPFGTRFWLNPPYSRCREFIKKAALEARNGATVVCLVPSRTDTRWWHSEVWDAEKHQPRPGVEIRFIKGRLKFGNSNNSAPFPSVVVIFRPPADPEAGTDTGVKR
jgi:phage N-6-adenine-methyltransferase